MTYSQREDDVLEQFDEKFTRVLGDIEAGVFSVSCNSCSHTCICCSNDCESCF